MSNESFTYSSRLPAGLWLDPNTGACSGAVRGGSIIMDSRSDAEADIPFIVGGSGEPSVPVDPSADRCIEASATSRDWVTFRASALPPGLQINPSTGVVFGTIGTPD